MTDHFVYSVFTKPWKSLGLEELAGHVKGLGFSAIELPIRDGFQVEPGNVAVKLPKASRVFAEHGVKIHSVAAEPTREMIAACGGAGVPILRIMVPIPENRDYLTHISDVQRQWDGLVRLLDEHGVTLGVQNHCRRFLTHAMHLYHAISQYDPAHVAAVWDAAHNALQGEDVGLALDVIMPHLRMVNLKNAVWRRDNEDRPGEPARWRHQWVGGRDGLCDWRHVADELHRRNYRDVICLTAEYHPPINVETQIADDLAFARQCFERHTAEATR